MVLHTASDTSLQAERLRVREVRNELVHEHQRRLQERGEPPIRMMFSIVHALEQECAARGIDPAAVRLEIVNRTVGDVNLRLVTECEGDAGGPGDYRMLADELGIALPGETLEGHVATGETYRWLRERMEVEERKLLDAGSDLRVYDFYCIGNPALRALLAEDMRRWGMPVTSGNVALAMGATDGIDKVLRGLALIAHQQGRSVGSVLVPSPVFNVPEQQAVAYGYHLHKVETTPESGFKLTAGQLAEALEADPDITIIYFNVTTNPTTFAYSPDELTALLDVLRVQREQGRIVYLLADLAYIGTGVPADDDARMRALGSVTEVFDQLICVSSMSKTHTLTGDRFGWVTFGDPVLTERMISSWISSVATLPGEWQLRFMAYHRLFRENPRLVEKIRDLYALRRTQLRDQLHRFDEHHKLFEHIYVEDDATIYNWSKIREGEDCYSVFEKTGVAGLPGSLFGYSDRYIRFSVGYLAVAKD